MAKKKTEQQVPYLTPSNGINGLGDLVKKTIDTVDKGLKAVGLDIIPEGCSDCERRRQALNRAFPFTKYVKHIISDEDIAYMDTIDHNSRLLIEDRNTIIRIYNTTFETNQENCSCPGIFKMLIDKIKYQIEYQRIK